MRRSNKIFVIFVSVLGTLLLAVSIVFAYFAVQAEKETASLNQIIGELDGEKASFESELTKEKEKSSELEKKLEIGASQYLDEIDELKAQIFEKDADIEKLIDELEKRKNSKVIDFTRYMTKFQTLEKNIENNFPKVRVKLTEEELENAKKDAEETNRNPNEVWEHRWEDVAEYKTQAIEKLKEQKIGDLTLSEILIKTNSECSPPKVAIYYEDLANGYVYTYNADDVFDGASVMKAPYITAVLEAISGYENGNIKINEDDKFYNSENINEMFDLEEKVILDHETMDKPGSGEIKDMPDGTEFTYEELFKYSLEKSDNIAFDIIKKKFTNKWYYDFASANGAKSPMVYEMNLSAREAGNMFKSIYYFTLTNKKYGNLVKDSLESSAHTVLSKSVLGANCIHKYGWDKNGYHDAAIVYGEHPYVAVVFTDMDCGGKETDAYIRSIFKQIDDIHKDLNSK